MALVIPRSHATDLLDVDGDDLAACADLAQQVARRAKERLGADGVNLLNCSGDAAWQSVFHFHFHLHVILRFKDDVGKDRIGLPWETVPSNLDEVRLSAPCLFERGGRRNSCDDLCHCRQNRIQVVPSLPPITRTP